MRNLIAVSNDLQSPQCFLCICCKRTSIYTRHKKRGEICTQTHEWHCQKLAFNAKKIEGFPNPNIIYTFLSPLSLSSSSDEPNRKIHRSNRRSLVSKDWKISEQTESTYFITNSYQDTCTTLSEKESVIPDLSGKNCNNRVQMKLSFPGIPILPAHQSVRRYSR